MIFNFTPFFEDNPMVTENFHHPDSLDNLKRYIYSLATSSFGFKLDDKTDMRYFTDNTALLRVQPVMGAHITDMPISEAVDFINKQNKENLVFFGLDEQLQDFALDKVHTIASLVKHNHKHIFYVIDDLDANEIYAEYCRLYNQEPAMKLFGGIHNSFHNIIQDADVEYLNDVTNYNNRPYYYVFYSRVPRSHRLSMLGFLINNGLINKGLVSALPEDSISHYENDPLFYEEVDPEMPDLKYLFDHKDIFPLSIDIDDPYNAEFNICHVTGSNKKTRDQTYFSLVSETTFWKSQSFLNDNTHLGGRSFTEKTFRPIALRHPFVLMSQRGALHELKNRGFETFSDFWDESYDTALSDSLRLQAIQGLVKDLCDIPTKEWDAMYKDLIPILEHNYKVFLSRPFDFTNGVDKGALYDMVTGKGQVPVYA